MRYRNVQVDAIGYELAPVVVASSEIERMLAPALEALRLPAGQLEALTGIAERRWWPEGYRISDGGIAAGRRALEEAGIAGRDLGAVIHAGVCREYFEPATACRVADALGVGPAASVHDVSNACLGVLTAMIDIANRIELGQIRAGLVVTCETAREINQITISALNRDADIDLFRRSLATFTGGSGAAAVVLSDGSLGSGRGHKLVGGAVRARPEHHNLCRWGITPDMSSDLKLYAQYTSTDAPSVLTHGVALGIETWRGFTQALDWAPESVARVFCHQVGRSHRDAILKALEIPPAKDFSSFSHLGNMGTAALPVTAAIANERGLVQAGDRVAFLGIGSGLNCMMLGLEW